MLEHSPLPWALALAAGAVLAIGCQVRVESISRAEARRLGDALMVDVVSGHADRVAAKMSEQLVGRDLEGAEERILKVIHACGDPAEYKYERDVFGFTSQDGVMRLARTFYYTTGPHPGGRPSCKLAVEVVSEPRAGGLAAAQLRLASDDESKERGAR